MASTPRAVSHRRRFLVGLAVAALLGAGLGAVLLAGARAAGGRERAERQSVVTLSALTEVVARAWDGAAEEPEDGGFGLGEEIAPVEEPEDSGGMGLGDELAELDVPAAGPGPQEKGEAVRRAVAGFAAAHPEVTTIRVVDLGDRRLEASTVAGESAPRQLTLDEKPLFDLGQKLRAAVEGNRGGAEGAARGAEIAVTRGEDGRLSLASPIEQDGTVVGLVQLVTRIEQASAGFAWLPFLAAWLAPVLLLSLLSLVLGDRRWLLAAAAAVLLIAALAGFGRYALRALEGDRRATAAAVAAKMNEESEKTGALLAELALPADGLDPSLWDVDPYRQPRGVLDEGRLGEEAGADASRLTRSVATLALISLALLAFVGLGYAARTRAALVEYRVAYAYVTPAMIGMLILVFFPFFYGIALSFTNANLYNTDQSIFETWIGLQNFQRIVSDFGIAKQTPEGLSWNYHNFYYTLLFTIVWTVSNVAIGVTLGLILALILNLKGFALKPLYRVLLILPWAVPNYITALIFRGMFHQQFGVINQILQIVGAEPVAWFGNPFTSYLAVLTTNGWLSFPFMMVISLGALQSIPADLYEAARVDGATRWQQFRSITLPSLRPALVPAVILSVIWTFNQFNVIYLVSAGEPGGATEILITESYKLAFEQYRYGYAAAYSTIIFLILLVYGTWQNRVTKATEALG